MKVCFCVHRLPYPPVAGGRLETYGLLAGLAERGHDLRVVAYADDLDRAAAMERELDCSVTTVPGVPDRTPGNLARNLASTDPLPVTKARSDRYRRAVRRHASDADVLHLHALQTFYLASERPTDAPVVARYNNVKHEIYRQFARRTRNPAKSLYASLQYLKTKRYETELPGASDLALTITAEDRDMLVRNGATGPIDVLPAGVDVSKFAPGDADADERTVTFFGSMDYHPNEDAAVWFADEIFPLVRREFDDAVFEVVGKDPPPSVSALADRPGVRVTGFVENIRDYVDRATVVVLPVRVGTGVRMKALHALSMGKPIVSTPVAMQGIRIEGGRHAAVAETASAFAAAVTELLADPDRRVRYGREARAFAKANHDWPTIHRRLEAHYEDVAGRAEVAAR